MSLAYRAVFVINLDDRSMPLIFRVSQTKDADEVQEPRLFYVSMTRASERLYLLHPRQNRSRFLHDLDKATIVERAC